MLACLSPISRDVVDHVFRTQPGERSRNKMTFLSRTALIALVIAAVASGIWLNRTAWRNRRLIWQLQAAVVAGGVGFVAGRLTAPDQKN